MKRPIVRWLVTWEVSGWEERPIWRQVEDIRQTRRLARDLCEKLRDCPSVWRNVRGPFKLWGYERVEQ